MPELNLGIKTKNLVSQICQVNCIEVESEFEALLLESELVRRYQPKYNIKLKDDKSFLYIKITKEEFPRVFAARKTQIQENAFSFGPFPSSGIVKSVLSDLRKIFPFRSCRVLPKNACLYGRINLCPAVCANPQEKKGYQKSVKFLKDLLKRKSKKVILDLNREMKASARNLDFEKASKLRDKIDRINRLLAFYRKPREYMENPNLVHDIRQEELADLKEKLSKYLKVPGDLRRIEAYDISNLSGREAAGSMVVFISGERDTSLYRRFKIRISGKPNDTQMMKEVLTRRFRHPEWDNPDLVIVDGGKGQVSFARKNVPKSIPVIGLAKKLEEIIILDNKNAWQILRLENSTPALNLVKRLRDEAHRFSKLYHLKLRKQTGLTVR